MDRYQYTALGNGTETIRLLRLLPGSKGDSIQVQLVPCEVGADGLEWEAISYCWGSQQSLKEIYFGKLSFSVSETVFKALWHLRQPGSPSILWLDSICINQEDIPEREQQLQLMAFIYTKATRVIVWLGDASAQQTIILNTLSYLVGPGFTPRRLMMGTLRGPNSLPSLVVSAFMDSRRVRRHTVRWFHRTLSGRPWFQRIWIVQEVALAKKTLIHCGAWTMDWELFYDILTYNGIPRWKSTQRLIIQLNTLHIMKKHNAKPEILGLLDGFRYQQVTDERDRIYGLLGLMTWLSHNSSLRPITFPIDYVSDVAEVYRNFALWHLKESSCLDILSLAWRRKGGLLDSLPTWVPDWSATQSIHGFSIDKYEIYPLGGPTYSAGQSKSLDFEYIPEEKGLRVTGVSFDIIRETMPARPTARRLWTDWTLFALFNQSVNAYKTHSDKEYAFEATLSAIFGTGPDSRLNLKLPPEPFSKKHILSSMMTAILQNDAKNLGQIQIDAIPSFLLWPDKFQLMQSLKLFRTSKGYLGIGDENIEHGDTVCILWGGNVPYILRDGIDGFYKHTGYVSNIPRRRLISECYVHGIMHGEAEEICREWGEDTRPVYIV